MLGYTILQVNCFVLGVEFVRYVLDATATKGWVISPKKNREKWGAERKIGLRPAGL